MADSNRKERMREYRKRYRETDEGRAKIRENNQKWKKSELGKQRAREYARKAYVPSGRILMTAEERAESKRLRERTYYAKNREHRLEMQRNNMCHLQRYGISKEDYAVMLKRQGGTCAICHGINGASRNRKILCVDHDHATRKIRGLLCDNCNKGIGCLKDDVETVRKALLYLEGAQGG